MCVCVCVCVWCESVCVCVCVCVCVWCESVWCTCVCMRLLVLCVVHLVGVDPVQPTATSRPSVHESWRLWKPAADS